MKKFLKFSQRAVIYTKDVMLITGKGRTAARDLIIAILESFGKKPCQFVTLRDFSEYTGIELETIREYLNP